MPTHGPGRGSKEPEPSAHGVLICDRSGRILDADPSAAALTGYTSQELRSRSISDLADSVDAVEARCWLERIQSGATVSASTGLRRKDGSVDSVGVRVSRFRTSGDFRAVVELRARRRASDRLPEDQDFVHAVLDASGHFLVVLDREARIVLLNKACADILGRTFSEVRGKGYREVFLRKDSIEREILGPGSLPDAPRGQAEWVDRDGRSRQIAWSLRRLPGPRGYAVLSGTDVTDLRELERRRSSEAALIDACGDALFTKTLDGTVTSWNPAARDLFGYAPPEIIGRSFMELVPDELRDDLAEVLGRIKGGEPVKQFETVCVHKGGSRREVLMTLSPIRDGAGQVFGVAAVAHDITRRRQADRELRASEQRLERAEGIARAGSWEWEVASGVVRWSSGLYRLYGVAPGRFKPALESYLGLVHAEDRARVRGDIARSVESGRPFTSECRVVRPDGTELLVWSRGEAIRDAEGRTVRLAGICQDVTERKRAEEALREREERLALAIEAADIGTWDWDPRTGALKWSRRCKELFGLPEDARVDLDTWVRSIHPDDRERILSLIEWVRKPESGGAYDTEYRTVGLADHIERWVRAQGRIYYDEKAAPRRGIGTVIDVTERKRVEQAAKDLNASLERRVGERTAELEGALQEMEAFTYAVAHDLRAPLRALHGLSDILLADYRNRPLDEDGQDYLVKIREASRRMDVLIQDILAYAQLGKGEVPRQPVELATLASGVLGLMAEAIRSRGAQVRLEEGSGTAVANPVLVTQALQNLISNALKFVPPGVVPDVRVKVEARDRTVRLSVEDNGIGIAPEHHERIFGVFQRLNRLEDYPGTGIGLALVRRAVERMGGRAGVRSEPGKGSTFWVELPRA